MRYSIMLLFSLVVISQGMAQETASFKVLYAESASIVGKQPSVLDELLDRDVVSSNGLLILAHRTGKFIEIKGDTTVNIGKMNQAILQSLGMKSCDNDWPNLTMIFENSFSIGQEPVSKGMPDVKWVIPLKQISVHPRQAIALLWESYKESAEEFELVFKTIFDEVIGKPLSWKQDRLVLPLDTFKLEEVLPHLIIEIRLPNEEYPRSTQRGIKFSETSYAMPDTFQASTAIKALEIAFHLEVNGGGEYAKPYYELAAELSNHVHYQQMIEAFKKRQIK